MGRGTMRLAVCALALLLLATEPASPAVSQAFIMEDTFGGALAMFEPETLAVAGCGDQVVFYALEEGVSFHNGDVESEFKLSSVFVDITEDSPALCVLNDIDDNGVKELLLGKVPAFGVAHPSSATAIFLDAEWQPEAISSTPSEFTDLDSIGIAISSTPSDLVRSGHFTFATSAITSNSGVVVLVWADDSGNIVQSNRITTNSLGIEDDESFGEALCVADVDGDGNADVIVSSSSQDKLFILILDSQGEVQETKEVARSDVETTSSSGSGWGSSLVWLGRGRVAIGCAQCNDDTGGVYILGVADLDKPTLIDTIVNEDEDVSFFGSSIAMVNAGETDARLVVAGDCASAITVLDISFEQASCQQKNGWPSVPVGTVVEVECPNSSDEGLVIIRECLDGRVWGEMTSQCIEPSCAADGSWPATVAGDTSISPCPSGFSGTWERQCEANEEWSDANDVKCVAISGVETLSCAKDGVWPETSSQTLSTVECSEGHMTRYCNVLGEWGNEDATGCTNPASCEEDGDWPVTPGGVWLSLSDCSGRGGTEYSRKRYCDNDGEWGDAEECDELGKVVTVVVVLWESAVAEEAGLVLGQVLGVAHDQVQVEDQTITLVLSSSTEEGAHTSAEEMGELLMAASGELTEAGVASVAVDNVSDGKEPQTFTITELLVQTNQVSSNNNDLALGLGLGIPAVVIIAVLLYKLIYYRNEMKNQVVMHTNVVRKMRQQMDTTVSNLVGIDDDGGHDRALSTARQEVANFFDGMEDLPIAEQRTKWKQLLVKWHSDKHQVMKGLTEAVTRVINEEAEQRGLTGSGSPRPSFSGIVP